MEMTTVALLGLGTMGQGMARNLLKAGFPLVVYNRTAAKAEPLVAEGARLARTPADAAKGAGVVLSMLAEDEASRTTWMGKDGALAAMDAGAIAIESSTVSPEWVAELATKSRERGVAMLDAPVTGSRPQAEAAQLTFLVGGEAAVLERARPVLAAMSKGVLHLGPVGSGTQMKLINNFLCGVQVTSFAEALAWIERSGLDRETALEFLKKAAPGSGIVQTMSERMTERTYAVNFLLKLMAKDMRYAHAAAESLGVSLTTGEAPEEMFSRAQAQGLGEKDMSAVVEVLRSKGK